VSGNRASLLGEHADHLIRVLRARIGQEFDISTGETVRRGRIAGISDGQVDFDLAGEVPASPVASLVLLLSVFNFSRMEWAIEKCVELGVSRIVPTITRRTDANLARASAKRVERWRRITLQAAEQSRRAGPPEVADPVKLREAVTLPTGLRILLSESEHSTSLPAALSAQSASAEVALAVGPEGGWTHDELRLFHEAGWISCSLGPTVLRAETAALAAAAIAMSVMVDIPSFPHPLR